MYGCFNDKVFWFSPGIAEGQALCEDRHEHVKIYECQWKVLTEQSPFWWEICFINICTDLLEILKEEWEKQSKL